jgi:hypothetical protein
MKTKPCHRAVVVKRLRTLILLVMEMTPSQPFALAKERRRKTLERIVQAKREAVAERLEFCEGKLI